MVPTFETGDNPQSMPPAAFTGRYRFHGLDIVVSADHPAVITALQSCLRHFPADGAGPPEMTFEFSTVPNVASHGVTKPQGHARHVYDPLEGEVLYFGDSLFVNYGDRGRMLCDPEEGRVTVSILDSEVDNAWFVSHPMFMSAFMEILKQRGLYSLHAAGLCVDGQGILLPGTRGSGKSTLAIALVREGFGFLGDDMVFLAHRADGLDALAFPDVIDVTEDTAAMFPELHHLLAQPKKDGSPKHQVRAEDVFPVSFLDSCKPRVLVFPSVSGRAVSTITPLDKDEALHELAPNVLLTDSAASQRHLDALAELVRDTKTFRLETGRDFAELGDPLRALVK